MGLFSFLILLSGASTRLEAYSVLSHEALIDAAWDPFIVPLLLNRYPNATQAQLGEAHAFAYGGSVVQDMGYYPFGSRLFSNLTHYVRAGDFVRALLDDSRDIDEYAFAVGALSHYVADNIGHRLAVNLSVPDMYPELRQKYGDRVTYEENPRAHVMVEFSFDVVQIAGAGYLPRTYHNFLGFRVARSLLERAFRDTYGLELGDVFFWEGLSIKVYEDGASEILPALTQVVWGQERKRIARLDPHGVWPKFGYRLSPRNYRGDGASRRAILRPWRWHWRRDTKHAALGAAATVVVYAVRVLPKIGPLHTLRFKPPTFPVQDMFIGSFDITVDEYETFLSDMLSGKRPILANSNLDTGFPTEAGSYRLADEAYEDLLNKLARQCFEGVTVELRQNILSYYANLDASFSTKSHPGEWQRTLCELAALRDARAGEVSLTR